MLFVLILISVKFCVYLLFLQVIPGSPADRAGFKPGDVVVRFDGKPVETIKEACIISHQSTFFLEYKLFMCE